MVDMLRKQIYISRRQQALLKRLAEERGTSESEIIRQAIDREASKINLGASEATRRHAWEEAYNFMLSLHAQGPVEGQRRQWKRADLYEERLSRYERHSD
jgi:hypothetical protein